MGEGGIGVLEVVGPAAIPLVGRLFQAKSKRPLVADTSALHYGHIVVDGEILDEVLVRAVPAEESRNEEDTVEINGHGGVVPLRRVMQALLARGAEQVESEALLARNRAAGTLDAIQEEAWRRLPEARSFRAAAMLLAQADGALSRQWRREEARPSLQGLRRLLATAELGRALVEPRRIVIAGAPNVGKSTLFNALLRRDRAIVTDIPGTTRDFLSEIILLDDVPFWLIDTAGLRDTDHIVEIEGVKGTWEQLREADAALFLLDASRSMTADERRIAVDLQVPVVIPVLNKIDLPESADEAEIRQVFGCPPCPVSALDGTRLKDLEAAILSRMLPAAAIDERGPVVFTPRQVDCLQEAIRWLESGDKDEAKATLQRGL